MMQRTQLKGIPSDALKLSAKLRLRRVIAAVDVDVDVAVDVDVDCLSMVDHSAAKRTSWKRSYKLR